MLILIINTNILLKNVTTISQGIWCIHYYLNSFFFHRTLFTTSLKWIFCSKLCNPLSSKDFQHYVVRVCKWQKNIKILHNHTGSLFNYIDVSGLCLDSSNWFDVKDVKQSAVCLSVLQQPVIKKQGQVVLI